MRGVQRGVKTGNEGGDVRWEAWSQNYQENESTDLFLHKNDYSRVNSTMFSNERNIYQSSDQSIITLSQLDLHASTVKHKTNKPDMMKTKLSEEFLRPLYQLPENPTNAEIRHHINGFKLKNICKVLNEDETKILNK
jgi:hypothetical protein